MDIDELRIVSQQKPQKNVNITELATYIGSGVIVLASLGFLGYSYVTANQAPQQVAYAATETAKKVSSRSIDDAVNNSFAGKVAARSAQAFAEDVYGAPSAEVLGEPKSVFAQDYQHCQEQWKNRFNKQRKDKPYIAIGMPMITKQMGGRSNRIANLIKCVSSEKRMARLCDDEYRAQFSKLVVKFMKSGKTNNLGMGMMQAAAKKNFAEMKPHKREAYFRSMKMGPYNPGYIRIKQLFKMGYLNADEYKGFFSSPKWLAKFEEVQGNHERMCANT